MVDDAAQKNLWEVRKAGLNIMMSLKGDGKPVSFIEDCAVPLEHLADYTDALTEVFTRHGTRGTWYAHASVGTLHVRPILDMRRDGAAKMRAIAEEASTLVRKYKGAFSGEHGDGLCRGEWIAWQFGAAINEAFRAIKNELDPGGLFNPGRIVDPPRMDDGALFRFPPPTAPAPYRTITLVPALDWSAWDVQNDPRTEETSAPGSGGDSTGGFAKAVEMCNNNGHCRKFDAGTMCPSFRVTRDEEHVTRGRANTLRLALSGQLGADALTSDAVHDALDLCVGCKGCKRECPTGVDMARMKIEFLAHYKRAPRPHAEGPADRRACPTTAHGLSRVPWLANLRDRVPGAAALGEKLARPVGRARAADAGAATPSGARARRGLFADAEATLAAARAGAKAALLFVDTFNGIFESENAIAAARVLKAAGYTLHTLDKRRRPPLLRPHLPRRAAWSTRRSAKAGALIDALLPFAEAGIAIVGLEPSCLLTLRDEALAMRPRRRAPSVVAAQALLFEEFIAREAKAGRFALELRADRRSRSCVHGHCHQKAFGAMQRRARRAAPDPGRRSPS